MTIRITHTEFSVNEPHSELTRLADEMGKLVPDGVRAIILLDTGDEDNGDAGMGALGYENDEQILEAMRRHLRAFLMARLGAPPS